MCGARRPVCDIALQLGVDSCTDQCMDGWIDREIAHAHTSEREKEKHTCT